MEDLISIIVPVYNSKAYLRECVQSVLHQRYPHFELILIDDGSQDGSTALCASLCEEDSRIRFLPRLHRGVSAARNAGIDIARGEYLFFLDSDDTMHAFLLEALLRLCKETGAALATEVYRHVDVSTPHDAMESLQGDEKHVFEYTYMDNAEVLRQFSSPKNGYNFQAIGGKLVLRSAAGSLRFHEDRSQGEDTLYVYQLLEKGLDAVILWEEWYEYRKHPGSSSNALTVQACEDCYLCLLYIFQQEAARKATNEATFLAMMILVRLRRLYVRSRRSHNREVSAHLRELARQEQNSGRLSLLSWEQKLKYFLAFHCYPLYLPLHVLSTLHWRATEWKQKQKRDKRNREDWNG